MSCSDYYLVSIHIDILFSKCQCVLRELYVILQIVTYSKSSYEKYN